jgi:glycosyltransferase 2 family protein
MARGTGPKGGRVKSGKERLAIWGGFLVSLVCLYFVFESVPLNDLLDELQRIQWGWVLPAFVLLYLGIFFRGARWWWLLGEGKKKATARVLLEGVFVGYAFNNILPSGRMGEFARALYVSKKTSIPVSVVFGTIVNDRVFDSLTVLLLVGATAFWVLPFDSDLLVEFGGFELSAAILNPLFVNVEVGSLGVVVIVLLLMIPKVADLIQKLLGSVPMISKGLKERLAGFVSGVFQGLSEIRDWESSSRVTYYTVLTWGLNAFAAYALAWAIPGLELSVFQSIGLMAIVTVCAAIPAAPGYWGLYEAGIIVGFQVLEIHDDQAVALAYGVTMHLIYYIPTTLIGLVLAFRSAIRLGSASSLSEKD